MASASKELAETIAAARALIDKAERLDMLTRNEGGERLNLGAIGILLDVDAKASASLADFLSKIGRA